MCVCLQRRQVCSYPLRTFAGLYCRVVCLGHFLLAVYLLLTLGTSVSIGPCLCASHAVFFSWCCGAPLFRCCCSGCLGVVVVLLLLALVAWVLAVGPAPSRFPPSPSPLVVFWCFLVQSVVCWSLLRISGCICNGPVAIPLAWRVVVDWLLSSLRFMATKASALCFFPRVWPMSHCGSVLT